MIVRREAQVKLKIMSYRVICSVGIALLRESQCRRRRLLPTILYVLPIILYARLETTDLNTWMAGSAEKLRQSRRHIGPVKSRRNLHYFQ